MSLQRCTRPLTSSTYEVSRFASLLTAAAARSHTRQLPNHRCQNDLWQSRRRSISVATAYQPYTLDPTPPPPRNTNIPDTSIAGLNPQLNDTPPPRQTGRPEPPNTPQKNQSISLTEDEAQTLKPISNADHPSPPSSLSTPSPETQKAKRATRLRPRKAAMTLTPTAAAQLRLLYCSPEPKYIRVGVKNRGCSGLAYHLEYVDKGGLLDESVEQDGVKVLIDSRALMSIIGSEMDWVEDKLSQRFVFRNPNIKEQCGCGESFMV